MRRWFGWVAIGAVVLVQCGGAGGVDPGALTSGAGSGGAGDAGGEAGAAGSDSGGGESGAGGGPVVKPTHDVGCPPCSADRRDVLDCNGHVVKTCGPDEACQEGQCVGDPCAVMAAAKTSYGCDFWAVSVVNFPAGACWATYVANVWPVPVKIQVEYDGKPLPVASFTRIPKGQGASLTYQPYDEAQGLPAGEVAVMFMSQLPGQNPLAGGVPCPPGIDTALHVDPTVVGTGMGKGFHVTTDRPVAAYEISPYGGGTAARTYATLLLPTTAWDTNYLAMNATKDIGPLVSMLASEDDTTVTIAPKANLLAGGGLPASPAGKPVSFKLKKGQYVQVASFATELTGSPILADKPIAVFGGNPCIGIGACCCDNAAQQLPPVRAYGHEYAAVRYRSRLSGVEESVPWRLMGAVDGTTLTYQPAPPPGAPLALKQGEMVEFYAPGPFLVASQDADHPFYMASYMTGGGSYADEGDPEFVNVVPTAQYLNSYVFYTDPTYSETELVLVRQLGHEGFADVNLDCGGTISDWQPLGPYEYARVALVTGNFESVNGCSNGRHEIRSTVPFGATVWGWGSNKSTSFNTTYVSYAYPAGIGVSQLSKTEIPPILE